MFGFIRTGLTVKPRPRNLMNVRGGLFRRRRAMWLRRALRLRRASRGGGSGSIFSKWKPSGRLVY